MARNPFKLPGVPKDPFLDEKVEGYGSMSRSLGALASDKELSPEHLAKSPKAPRAPTSTSPRFKKLMKIIKGK